jgi:hypothetical protein
MATVPMFDPTGTIRMVPPEQTNAALQAGGKPAVQMIDPSGTQRWVPQDQQAAALQAGGKLVNQPPAAPVDNSGYDMTSIMNRVGHSPSEFVSNVKHRLAVANQGLGQGLDTAALPIEKLARAVGISSPTLDAQIAHDTAVSNAPPPAATTEDAGNIDLGRDAAQAIEYMGLHKFVQGLGLMAKIEQLGPVAKVLKANPNIARVVTSIMENGVAGGAQAGIHGGDTGDVLTSSGVAAAGGGATELRPALRGRMGDMATEVQPEVRNILGSDGSVLPSEAQDVNGVSTATPLQQKSANIANEPQLRAERQAAFRDIQQNLAKRFVANATTDLNNSRAPELPVVTDESRMLPPPADYQPGISLQTGTEPQDVSTPPRFAPATMQVVDPATVANPNYQPPGGEPAAQTGATDTRTPAQQRLDALGTGAQAIPQESVTGPQTIQQPRPPVYNQPEITSPPLMVRTGGGMIKLSPEQARAMVSDLDVKMRDPELGVREKSQLEQQQSDLTDQLNRYDEYLGQQPHFPPYNVPDVVANTDSFGHAADHLQAAAAQKFNAMPDDVSDQFRQLRSEARGYQQDFDTGNDAQKQTAFNNLDDVNSRVEQLFNQPDVRSQISGTEAEQGFKEYRLAQGAKALQNLFDRHMSYTPDEAAEGGRSRTNVARNMENFPSGLRKVEARYGDVLKPYMGDDSFAGLRDIGDLLNTKVGQDQAKTIAGNAAMALRRHLAGIRGVSGLGIGAVAASTLAHSVAGPIGGLGYLTTEGAYHMIVNRMATDPAFAQKVIFAAKNNVSPRIAGPLLAATFLNAFRDNTTQQPTQPQQGGQQQ